MRKLFWVVMCLVFLCFGGNKLWCADMPGPEKVWTYFSFDGTTNPILPSEPFRGISVFGPEPATVKYTEGLSGNALSVVSGGGFVSVIHGRKDFPTERGTMIVWFKPNQPLGKEARWLVEGSWASFSLSIEGNRLIGYATGNSQHLLSGSLKDWEKEWTGQWHMAALAWDGDKRHLFFNGKLLVERAEVAPFQAPNNLWFGLIHRPRDIKNPYNAVLDGAIDEFALLSVNLNSAQIAEMYRQGRSSGYKGLLSVLGGVVAVQMPRRGYIRGETAQGKVVVYADGDTVKLTAVKETGGVPIPLATLPGKTAEFNINTNDLRPGRYRIRAEILRDNKVVSSDEKCLIGINAERRPEFPIGLDGIPVDNDELLRNAASWHIDHTSAGGDVSTSLYWRLDCLYTYGIGFTPNLNIHYHRALPLPEKDKFFDPVTGNGNLELLREKVLQVLVLHGDTSFKPFSSSSASPFSPLVQEAMRQRIKDYLKSAQGHPGLVSISFDDEYVFRMVKDKTSGKMCYGDYSPGARQYFTSQTGLSPVFPPLEPKGTIFDDNHPYFKWKDIIGMPHDASCAGLAKIDKELTELIHSIRPDIQTTTWSGGEYGTVDVIMDYAYPSIWQPHPGYNIGHGRVDFQMDRHRARQRVEPKKPLWGLVGWWSDDLSKQPSYCVPDFRLNTIMALTKGAESITWFTLYLGGILSREDLKDEMVKWADWIYRYGPMFKRFQVLPSKRAAVLLSEENIAGHIAHTGGGLHMFDASWFYPALRIAGVPVDIVTDEQVKAGVLDGYEALVLYNFNYASHGLLESIRKFAGTPDKKVFVDKATELRPDGAVQIPFIAIGGPPPQQLEKFKDIPYYGTQNMAWMAGQLRNIVTPKLAPSDLRVNGSDLVSSFWLHSRGKGRGKLLILVNYDTTKAQSVEVFFNAPPETVVQELEGGRVAAFSTSSQPVMIWKTELGPADWKVYWVYEGKLESFNVKAEYGEGQFRIECSATDSNMQPLMSGLPVKVELFGPDGKEIEEYRQYTALSPDTGRLNLRIPRAKLMDGSGTWTVKVTEMITGNQATASFEVK